MPCWRRVVKERSGLPPRERERPVRFTTLLAFLLIKEPLKPRRRKDEYFLLLLLSENFPPNEALKIFVEGLLKDFGEARQRLLAWLDEEFGLETFLEQWRERFKDEPTVEAFWLYLAKEAFCAVPEGCLEELCAKDAFTFAWELLKRAPGDSWLLWRRKKNKPQNLDDCQKIVLKRAQTLWRDELSRKLIHQAGRQLDGALAQGLLRAGPLQFPTWFLAAPLWYPYVERWLEQVQEEAANCGGEAYMEVHSPPFPELFDEFTAPLLPKRRGCRSQRPGLGFWGRASRNVFPASFEAGVRAYGSWAKEAAGYQEHKKFAPHWPDPWDTQMDLINAYVAWFETLVGGEEAP